VAKAASPSWSAPGILLSQHYQYTEPFANGKTLNRNDRTFNGHEGAPYEFEVFAADAAPSTVPLRLFD
jgi:hypothetical protein